MRVSIPWVVLLFLTACHTTDWDAYELQLIAEAQPLSLDHLEHTRRQFWEALASYDYRDTVTLAAGRKLDTLFQWLRDVPWEDPKHPFPSITIQRMGETLARFQPFLGEDYMSPLTNLSVAEEALWENRGLWNSYFLATEILLAGIMPLDKRDSYRFSVTANQPMEFVLPRRWPRYWDEPKERPPFLLKDTSGNRFELFHRPILGGWMISHPGLPVGVYQVQTHVASPYSAASLESFYPFIHITVATSTP